MLIKKVKILSTALLLCSTSALAHESSVWSYVGDNGPKQWGQIDTAFLACSEGILQSPIDVKKENLISNKDPIIFDYNAHDFSNNIADFKTKGKVKGITVDGVEYHLSQFHFHTPSEHSIDGKIYPDVAHFVHHDKDDNLAVVGVLFEVGNPNEKFKKIIDSTNMDIEKKRAVEAGDITELLPVNREYFHYMGSLTTPPCTEGVNWFLMKNPVEVSQEDLDALVASMPNNARPIQDPKGRVAQ